MQARCSPFQPPVEGDRARGECPAQFIEVGVVREQATPGELVEYVGHSDIVPSLPACAETGLCLARRGAYGRYTDTVGSPVIQNRHGRSPAALTPTRGPELIAAPACSAGPGPAVTAPSPAPAPLACAPGSQASARSGHRTRSGDPGS